MSVVVCSLGDSFQRLPLNFKVTSYEIGHSLPSLEWTQKNKFKELRAVFRKQWKRAIVDLTSKTARILSHICTLNFAEERWGRCLYISWFQYGPPSQEGSCTSTYFGVPVYYPPPTHTAPFCLLLSIPPNAKATINREVHFVLIQYPRASYEKTLTAWSRVAFSDLRHCHTENRLSFLGVFCWSFVGPILEGKNL